MDLPDSLDLPLRDGSAWWYWLGGRPALDFVNTHRERWWRNVETLVTPGNLAAWLVQAGLLDREPRVSPALLKEARALRDAVDALCVATLAGRMPPAGAVAVVDRWLSEATAGERLAIAPDGGLSLVPKRPADPARHALGLIARDAAEMLGTEQRHRLRICASETCSARFFDRSRGARRRWCSMQACGNTAKVRRHRERRATPDQA